MCSLFILEHSDSCSLSWGPELKPHIQFRPLMLPCCFWTPLLCCTHTHRADQIHWPAATRSIHTIPFCWGCSRVHARMCMCWRPFIPLQRMLTLFPASLSLSIPCPLSLVNYTETAGLSSLIWKDTTPWRADPVTLLLIPKSSTHSLVDNQKLHTEDADTKKTNTPFCLHS